ncbi:hypothetical protein JOE25_003187 [Serratia sp. PL17]|jgi:hypothetical protein|nr:hypothetical protein [Serratia sp. PL17]
MQICLWLGNAGVMLPLYPWQMTIKSPFGQMR